jgi:hypothetical protein
MGGQQLAHGDIEPVGKVGPHPIRPKRAWRRLQRQADALASHDTADSRASEEAAECFDPD